jgi:hypothetical protein
MKGYIIGPRDGGEGVYTLVAEDGEGMCSHLCSSASYAKHDLYSGRPERAQMFAEKGITEVAYLKDSPEMTEEHLLDLNRKWKPVPDQRKGSHE